MSTETSAGLKQNFADVERLLMTASTEASGRMKQDAEQVERVLTQRRPL